ncbi:MAG: AAA family ATPase [Rhodospirillales bacterium]|nr:AAA family ATPase [Rhodospirillales bacterium]
MTSTDQQPVIDFLRAENALGAGPVQVNTTHVSKIFLSGERALKMKRAVKFPFLDFQTLEARHQACVQEVEINRRTAPSIYKGVVAVTKTPDGGYELGGAGTPVEWLVDMVRFDEDTLFDRLAGVERGLRRPRIEALADTIAEFHAAAEIRATSGGHAGIRMIAENNARSFEILPPDSFEKNKASSVAAETLKRIDNVAAVLDDRRDAGRVRICHGDLHLRNICLIDDKPTLFDAIEFSSDFSDIDVMYDLAFLLMDLDFHGLRRLSAFLLNRYLDVGDERADVFQVLPIFLSMRAQIRAHVGAAIARAQEKPEDQERELATARRYLELAEQYLQRKPPRLVAVGGLSGSGKSRLAREIASHLGQAPGARVVRTDVVRKRLNGIHPNESLGAHGYTSEMTEKTYQDFFGQARSALAAGQCVVLDAVFAKAEQRAQADTLAIECGVPYQGLWVDAPEHVRVHRVETRERNVSDVTTDVARQQSEYELGPITWAKIDSSGKKNATIDQALKVLKV